VPFAPVRGRSFLPRWPLRSAVRGIDLAVAPGETVALLGLNGAGKTTTIDMILGLARPDSGTVSVFGASPTEAVKSGWVGGTLQDGSPPDQLKVRELVTLVASYYPHPLGVDDVLRQTGTADLAGRWASKLSGGQARRVRFAAALVGDPDLLVLDEPTAGIDVEGRIEFWQAMRAVAERGKTILFATHYLEEADANADRIVLMARGRIVADGPGTEIKAKVGSRSIRATLPVAGLAELRALPGVLSADLRRSGPWAGSCRYGWLSQTPGGNRVPDGLGRQALPLFRRARRDR
jgi:ABC-2 type transport system ATP-binding protein